MCALGQDRPPESVPDQPGQVAAVIQVRRGDGHGVDAGGVAGELLPAASPQVGEALEETAVDHNPRIGRSRPGICCFGGETGLPPVTLR